MPDHAAGTQTMATAKSSRLLFGVLWLSGMFFLNLPNAHAGDASILDSPGKAVVAGPTENPDYITGWQGDLILTQGYYNSSFIPSTRRPIFAFAETDLQLGYMLPVIGSSFYRGNFEGLANIFVWASTRETSGVLGGGALGLHYNFVQPGWRFVPYLGVSMGLSGNDLYRDLNQTIIGGPFEFVLQANLGARYFINRSFGLLIEGGYQHVSNADIYPRNFGLNQIGGHFGIFCLF
jgi:Lipid A 3-O-deacylase (PagL)